MGETTLEIVALEFLDFLFGLLGGLLSTFVWWWVAYTLLRYLLQNIVFKSDSEGWKKFVSNVRLGFVEFSDAFRNTMSGAAYIAVRWAMEKKENLSKFRSKKSNGIDSETYW